jgi:hypothetical protein
VADREQQAHFHQIIEEIDQLSQASSPRSADGQTPDEEDSAKGSQEESLAMDDKDARRLLIVNYIRKRMEQIAARKMKPGFENFKDLLELFDTMKTVLLTLMIVFIIFSRPKWCQAMGNEIDFSCTEVLDPKRQVQIIKSWIPVLSSSTKYIICTLSMVTVCVLDCCIVGFSVSNKEERRSTIIEIVITLGYLLCSLLSWADVYSIAGMDLFAVFFLLTSLKLFRQSMLLFIEIIARAKFVFVYAGMFIVASSAVYFILFAEFDSFTDAPQNSYYTYRFTTYPESLQTSVWALLGDKINIPSIMSFLLENSVFNLVLFVFVSFFIRFFVQSYLVGVTYYFFSRYFKDNVLDLREKHAPLEATITQMIKEDRVSIPELNQALAEYLTPPAEKDSIIEMEKLYLKAVDKVVDSATSKNPDSGYTKLAWLNKHSATPVILACLEVLVICLLIVTAEAENKYSFSIYIVFFIINFLTVLRQIMALATDRFVAFSVLGVIEVFISIFVNSLISVALLSTDTAIFAQILDLNPALKKIIGVLMALKIINFLKLLTHFHQIRMTVFMLMRCVRFILDILMNILIIIFIFSSIGIVLFGGQVNNTTGEKYKAVYGDDFNDNYLLLNFNDYYYAVLTLLTIAFKGVIAVLRVNTVETQNYGAVPLFFFIGYLFLISTCLLNILFGFLIDNVSEYLKDHRMEFNENKYTALAREARHGRPGDDDGKDHPDDSALKKSDIGKDTSHFSEDLDVYLDLKKKKPEKEVSRLVPLQEEDEIPDVDEKADQRPDAPATDVLPAAPEEPQIAVQGDAPVEPVNPQNQSVSEESEFRGTPINYGAHQKFNPLTGLVKRS